ncbi:MAG TPA: hypothetical protein VH679_16075 [Vicinamibacterales bacterium]|jgi:hypothetical protein
MAFRGVRYAICAWALVTAGCVTTLPDQDLRIRESPPIAKMPAELLWKEYQADAKEADRRYWGKAIEISGTPTRSDKADSGGPSANYVFFKGSDQFGVRANLIDEDAAEIMKVVSAGQRIRLKCFCAGLDGNVILKSCVKG